MGKFIKRCFVFMIFIGIIGIGCSILYVKLSPSLNINSTNSIQLIDSTGSVFFKGNESKEWVDLDDISDYDVIYIGAPIYWGTMPQPMFTELERLDFNGKIIMPFTTHEGSGLANVVNDIKKLAKGAIIKEGLPISGSSVNNSKGKIEEWIKRNI